MTLRHDIEIAPQYFADGGLAHSLLYRGALVGWIAQSAEEADSGLCTLHIPNTGQIKQFEGEVKTRRGYIGEVWRAWQYARQNASELVYKELHEPEAQPRNTAVRPRMTPRKQINLAQFDGYQRDSSILDSFTAPTDTQNDFLNQFAEVDGGI